LFKTLSHPTGVTTLTAKERINIFNENKSTYYDIKLLDFATDDHNYQLLQKVGFEKYFLNLWERIEHTFKKIRTAKHK
jgi:hypothetical protein